MLDWESIIGQWRAIKRAPAAFVIAVLTVAGIIWVAINWGYGRIIENKDFEILRLTSENSRLRVAANMDPATNAMSLLTNKELKAKAISMVSSLRRISSVVSDRTAEINGSKLDDEARTSRKNDLMKEMDDEYIKNLRSEAQNIESELKRRLGQKTTNGIIGVSPAIVATDGTTISMSQIMAGINIPIFDLGFVPTLANSIEQMGKLLPEGG